MNYFGCEFKNETITLTRPGEGVSIRDCDFMDVSICNSLVRYLTFEDCNFNDIDINRCCDLGYAEFKRCRFTMGFSHKAVLMLHYLSFVVLMKLANL